MSLDALVIEDFRCVVRAELELDSRCNLISGANASGKTSLLEAIFVLGRGRSFRTARTEILIRNGDRGVYARGQGCGRRSHVGRSACGSGRDGMEARVSGRPVNGLAELATVLPAQAIDPEVHRLVEGGPQERRRFVDWGVFHVEPSFVDHWRRYQRALRQRNAALRTHQPPSVVRAWDPELIEAGQLVADYRRRYMEQLVPHVAEVGTRLLGEPVEIALNQGWSADRTLEEATKLAWVAGPGARADPQRTAPGRPERSIWGCSRSRSRVAWAAETGRCVAAAWTAPLRRRAGVGCCGATCG